MKNTVFKMLAISVVLSAMQVAPSFAEVDYYVELGKDTSKDEALANWKGLVAKHKTILSKLQFFPKSVIQGGTTVGTRIQAGPINNKNKAQKICSKLFTDDVPCFVIEGNGSAPSEVMNLSESRSGGKLPWLNTDIAAPPPVKEAAAPSVLPWLANKQPDTRKPQVQVAEAIRVPLTDNFDPNGSGKVTVRDLDNVKPTFRKQFAENKPQDSQPVKTGAGWLTLDSFANEDVATSFWEEARSGLPKGSASTLHVRVQRPMMSGSKASLAVGPFASNNEALAFCDNIQARDRGLNCIFDGGTVATGNTQLTHGKEYGNRRMAELRKRPSENLGTIAPAAGPSKQYWVQVLAASSQMDALHQWETMKSSNTDLMNGMRSSVSKSATDKSSYVVRVGPIANNDDAIKFCGKLQGRGINCRVLLYSIGL